MILDNFLEVIANSLVSGTTYIPAALSYSTDVTAVTTSDTSVIGEISRTEADNEASGTFNVAQWSTTRSATSVIESTGDSINKLGVHSNLSATDTDDLVFSALVIPETVQTTAFDIQTTFTYTVDRQ